MFQLHTELTDLCNHTTSAEFFSSETYCPSFNIVEKLPLWKHIFLGGIFPLHILGFPYQHCDIRLCVLGSIFVCDSSPPENPHKLNCI